ncbi:MAG: hypothetical protein JSV22_02435 [Bacteroidales bacterium]|nr:MAG: hypothetical protein JSV22_02435 [Bacteroidales bacterium]
MKLVIPDKFKKLNTFFLQIVAIFIGITISFWVENYRENLSKADIRKDVIKELYLNLELDSIRASYVSDSLIGHGLAYYPDRISYLREDRSANQVEYMLAYMYIYISFWQTKYAYNKLQNLQFEKTLTPEILEKIDFYYQVINELHGIKRSEIAKEMFIKRKEYLNRKGIYVLFLTTWDRIENPILDEDILERFTKNVLADPEFEAIYYERIQLFYDWQHSLESIKYTATELRDALRTHYKFRYKKNIDKELGEKEVILDNQVIRSRT